MVDILSDFIAIGKRFMYKRFRVQGSAQAPPAEVASCSKKKLQLCGAAFEDEKKNSVIWKEQVVLIVGAACSRDHFISRLACDELSRAEAAPTGGFLW